MHQRTTFFLLAAGVMACLAGTPGNAQTQPATDSSHLVATSEHVDRVAMETMQIPSHGALMNALVYVAAGPGPHPAVILLHGFPGNERNLDLAQDMRRAGWDVLYFNYRGSWGTPGDFSFSHGIDDTAAALAYLRQSVVARKLRLDPTHIVLIGHSMGGFMTVEGAAADPAIKAFATISAADMGGTMQHLLASDLKPSALHKMSSGLANDGMAPLSGCTPGGLARELAEHAATWTFSSKVDALKSRTVLMVTSDDGLAKAGASFATHLRNAGDTHVTTVHLPTGQANPDQRIEPSHAVPGWLAALTR